MQENLNFKILKPEGITGMKTMRVKNCDRADVFQCETYRQIQMQNFPLQITVLITISVLKLINLKKKHLR